MQKRTPAHSFIYPRCRMFTQKGLAIHRKDCSFRNKLAFLTQVAGINFACAPLYEAKLMIKTKAVYPLKKTFILILAASVLQALMPAFPPQSTLPCCSVEAQRSSPNACCTSRSPRRLLCCTDEAKAPASNVAQIPAPENKPLRAGLDLAPQPSFTNNNAFDYCPVNLSFDFYSCNVVLTSNQRYKLSALLLI